MAPLMSEPSIPDDVVSAFQIEGEPVRGRVVRLGSAVDEILQAHAYPEVVANLLGEACALAAVVGANLKFEGRLIVQAQGSGPVRFVVAPNWVHHLYAGKVAEVYPGARLWVGPGLELKRPDLVFEAVLGDEAPAAWKGQVDQVFFRGRK